MKIRRLLQLTSAVLFVDTVMFAAITPLLPRYVETFGLTKTGAGILTASYPAGTVLAALPAIWFARRFGVKLTVFCGLSLLAASTAAFAGAESVASLDLARFAQGFSGSFSWGGALGWLVGQAPRARRGETIGFALAAALVGAMLGPALGGLAVELSPSLVFRSVAAASLVLAAVTLTVPPPAAATTPEVRQIPVALRDVRVRTGLWMVLLFGLSYGAIDTLAPLQMDAAGLGGVAIALTFIASVAIETVLAPLIGRLTDRRGRLAPLKLCLPLSAVVLLGLGWASSAGMLILMIVLCGMAIGPLWTPGTALFSDGAADAGVDHVVSFSLSNVAWALGGSSGAYSAGALADASSEPVPYSLLAVVATTTLLWVQRNRAALSAEPAGLGSTSPGN
jgi:MFS family permease